MEFSFDGIAIMGLNGSGKSTLAHALAKEIGYFEIDVEDYYFPEQRESRRAALDNIFEVECCYLGELPYTVPRSKAEVQEAICKDVTDHPKFIISGVTMDWDERVLSHIDIVFILNTPTEIRLQRVDHREMKRFGARVSEGGDMFNQQIYFRKKIAAREYASVLESAQGINCRIICLDGLKTVKENVYCILSELVG